MITQKIGRFLKRYPALYKFSVDVYGKYYPLLRPLHLAEIVFGTWAREREWAWRGEASARNGYWSKRNSAQVQFFCRNICNFNFCPERILEIGSNCGPNLWQLAKRFPIAEIVGIDVNRTAVDKGNKWLKDEGITNVKLQFGKADKLEFPDKHFDVVFTWAVLLYIGPDKIGRVMKEMIRVTRKKLILIEAYSGDIKKDPRGFGVYSSIYWKRNYVALLKQFVPEFPMSKVSITPCPEHLWAPGCGGAAIIEFSME